MANYITRIRTESGDMQIDYKSLANLPDAPTPESIGAAPEDHTHSYKSIEDAPKIPTKLSELENDSGFMSSDKNVTYTLTKSGSTITLTGSDGSTNSVEDDDTCSLNDLGVTATATEINYLSGVTSGVQKQLDDKAALDHEHSVEDIISGALEIERGGTGSNDGAIGLANLFAAGPTILSPEQYGDEFPEDCTDGRFFLKRVIV
jgi:hypothetical protein